MEEYTNKLKLTLAEDEARIKGGDVRDIYLRMGGNIKVIEEFRGESEPKPKKTRKK